MAEFVYLNGEFVPEERATVSVKTHALQYGTGCFEGIRGYWNGSQQQLFLFRLQEHYERMALSASILCIDLPHDPDEMVRLTVELLRRNNLNEDVYVRPFAYKADPRISVQLRGIKDGFCIYSVPFGNYIDVDRGIRCCISSWRRIEDNTIPARAKVTGGYINSALAKQEALDNGYDEAILLDSSGHISEGSGENLFMVVGGKLVTPPVSDNILVGITRHTIMTIAQEELGIETIERPIDRTELYVADEILLCGTGAQIAPVAHVDHRLIGRGSYRGDIGPVTAQLQQLYFSVVRGEHSKYRHWCTPVYEK